MFIGTKIKEIRLLKKLSRQAMADQLDISLTALRNIEEDKTDINFSRLQQIATVFNMNVAELVGHGEKIVQINGDNSDNNNHLSIYQADTALAQENNFLKEKIALLETTISDLRKTMQLLENSN
jgi:transcriptional regulator with XRE-family HTH domain